MEDVIGQRWIDFSPEAAELSCTSTPRRVGGLGWQLRPGRAPCDAGERGAEPSNAGRSTKTARVLTKRPSLQSRLAFSSVRWNVRVRGTRQGLKAACDLVDTRTHRATDTPSFNRPNAEARNPGVVRVRPQRSCLGGGSRASTPRNERQNVDDLAFRGALRRSGGGGSNPARARLIGNP